MIVSDEKTVVKELDCGHNHVVTLGAPCQWSEDRGATHTLHTDEWNPTTGKHGGTRPARLLKTVLYVGVDETPGGNIKWEKWRVRKI